MNPDRRIAGDFNVWKEAATVIIDVFPPGMADRPVTRDEASVGLVFSERDAVSMALLILDVCPE